MRYWTEKKNDSYVVQYNEQLSYNLLFEKKG